MAFSLKVAVCQLCLDCEGGSQRRTDNQAVEWSVVQLGCACAHGPLTFPPPQLTPGGKAAQAGVAVGDWVLSIDGENAGNLTHIEAQNKIRACGECLSLGLSRYRGGG